MTNPAYPNGQCNACGWGLRSNRTCPNEDCTVFTRALAEIKKSVRIPGTQRTLTYDVGLRLVQAVAACYGQAPVNDDDAGFVLWNQTGFPSFFEAKPIEECRHQIARFFKRPMGG